jgi:hypothetical protein
VANQPDLIRSGSFQSQSQNGGGSHGQQQTSHSGGFSGNSQQQGNGSFGPASLFVPGTRSDWWPADLRFPNSTGAQNNVRYAYFAQARRLVIDVQGTVTVYDTLDHQIGGFSQQQSVGGTLSFNSQYGLIDVASLPVISSNGQPPRAPFVPAVQQPAPWQPAPVQQPAFAPQSSNSGDDVFATIEKLSNLRAKGILSDDEFSAKKAELLSRV